MHSKSDQTISVRVQHKFGNKEIDKDWTLLTYKDYDRRWPCFAYWGRNDQLTRGASSHKLGPVCESILYTKVSRQAGGAWPSEDYKTTKVQRQVFTFWLVGRCNAVCTFA